MTTSVRSSSVNGSTSGTAISVAAPTGTADGDVVVVVIGSNGTPTISDNNGATPFTQSSSGATGSLTQTVYYRRMQSGDPTTYNFTSSVSNRWTAVAVALQNPHASVELDVAASYQVGTGTAGTAPSINTTADNALHFACLVSDNPDNTITATPAGYTVEQNGAAFTCRIAVTYLVILSAGATGAQSFTQTLGVDWVGSSFAIRDDGAGGGSVVPVLMAQYRNRKL